MENEDQDIAQPKPPTATQIQAVFNDVEGIANGGGFDTAEAIRSLARMSIVLQNRIAAYENAIGIVNQPPAAPASKKKG